MWYDKYYKDVRRQERVKAMKLFDKFEVVKFPQENMLFVTKGKYIYYVYNPKYEQWEKYKNAGNDSITVEKYQDVSKQELMDVMQGVFPEKETDFMRLCRPSQLWISDMMTLLEEDYPSYMSDFALRIAVHTLLIELDVRQRQKAFLELNKCFSEAADNQHENGQLLVQIKELCFAILGRDVFKKEIGIVDGHDSSSYFWIMPVRVLDYSNTNELDNVVEMRSAEISIEEDDVYRYLTPFLDKHFDADLPANKNRVGGYWIDEEGNEEMETISGFEWNLTHNFYTFDAITNMLRDIRDTVAALTCERETEFTVQLKEKATAVHAICPMDNAVEPQRTPYEDADELACILDFYRRFLFRMEYMLKVGKERGYTYISVMGP
jgi:hypothetical protein